MFKYNLNKNVKYIIGSIGYVYRKFAGLNSAFIFWLVVCFEVTVARSS